MTTDEEKPLMDEDGSTRSYSDPPTPASPDVLQSKEVPGFPKIIKPRRTVVIEPVLLLYALAMMGAMPVFEQYLYARFKEDYPVLMNRTQNENVTAASPCQNVSNSSDPIFIATEAVQSETSKWQMYIQVSSATINIFTTLFYGAYSDVAGRRIVLILPCAASLLKFILNSFIIYFQLPVPYFLIGTVLDGLSGGFYSLMMGSFAYIADTTTPEKRGMRIAIAEGCLTGAMAVTQLGVGYYIRAMGFFYPYVTMTGILFLNLVYVVFFVPETVVKRKDRKFSFTASVKETYTTYSESTNGRNVKVTLLILAIFLNFFPFSSKMSIQMLFTMNVPLCWTSVEIGYFMAASALALQLGGLLGIKGFKMCGMPEAWIAVIGCLSGIANCLINAWADTLLLMLMVCVAGVLMMGGIPMYRTMISRQVREDEQGKIFSGIACIEAIGSLVGSVVLNLIYQQTLFFMKGFVFLVCALFMVAAIIVTFIYMCYDRAKGKEVRHHVIN